MAVSAVSAATSAPQQYFNPQATRQAFGQLVGAVQSGNLADAQSAYATLAQSPLAQGNSPFAQALQQIGQDLQAGDIDGAKKALSSLQQQQQVRGHHHHHHGGGAQAKPTDPNDPSSNTQTPDAVTGTTSSDTGNSVNITA